MYVTNKITKTEKCNYNSKGTIEKKEVAHFHRIPRASQPGKKHTCMFSHLWYRSWSTRSCILHTIAGSACRIQYGIATFLLPCILQFYYARQQNASRVSAMVLASVGLCVRVSVTPLSPIKMVQAKIMKSWLRAATRSLVFLRQNFISVCEEVPLERVRQRGVPF